MSLKFTALKVGEGDAFLLQDGEWNYLFDAGGSQSNIVKLLQKEKVKDINIAICSHNDKDHANGFKGLLDSNKNKGIQIHEIWLPALWCVIINYAIVNRNKDKLWSNIEKHLSTKYNEDNSEEWDGFDIDELFGDEFTYATDVGALMTAINEIDISSHKNSSKACAFVKSMRKCSDKDVVKKLNNIIRIVSLAIQQGCKIVWFRNVKPPYCAPYIYGFIPLNSKPICITKFGIYPIFMGFIPILKSKHFIKAVNLSAVNHFSLVFEFWKERVPVVRFSADSDCVFKTYNTFTSSIIITAPHHGSPNNKKVYSKINGNDIIWVRTYHRKDQLGCKTFLRRPDRYCVKCPAKKVFQKINFEYQSGKWQPISGKHCQCK